VTLKADSSPKKPRVDGFNLLFLMKKCFLSIMFRGFSFSPTNSFSCHFYSCFSTSSGPQSLQFLLLLFLSPLNRDFMVHFFGYLLPVLCPDTFLSHLFGKIHSYISLPFPCVEMGNHILVYLTR
jgi:hypothetical protein